MYFAIFVVDVLFCQVGDVNYLFYLCFATNVVMSPAKTMGSKKVGSYL